MPSWISSTGTPQVGFILPPYWLMMSCSSLRHAGGAVHHQVGVGQALVDLDRCAPSSSTSPVGFLRELVGAVAGADGDGQRIDAGLLHELHGLVGIGQVREAVDAGAVAVFDAAQAAEFAFHGDAARVRHLHHFAGDLHVVFEVGRRLAVCHQRAVHHHAGEAHLDGATCRSPGCCRGPGAARSEFPDRASVAASIR